MDQLLNHNLLMQHNGQMSGCSHGASATRVRSSMPLGRALLAIDLQKRCQTSLSGRW